MIHSVLNDLSTALDLVVLVRLPEGGLYKAADTHIPIWFTRAFGNGSGDEPVSLVDAFPLLGPFLQEAEPLWSGDADGRMDSEPFVIAGSSGSEMPVTATALAVRGRHYLILQSAAWFNDRQRDLQTARDQALAYERAIRQVQALQKPIATLSRLVSDPGFTRDDRHGAADAIRQQVDVLRGLLDALPQAPRGATPKGR